MEQKPNFPFEDVNLTLVKRLLRAVFYYNTTNKGKKRIEDVFENVNEILFYAIEGNDLNGAKNSLGKNVHFLDDNHIYHVAEMKYKNSNKIAVLFIDDTWERANYGQPHQTKFIAAVLSFNDKGEPFYKIIEYGFPYWKTEKYSVRNYKRICWTRNDFKEITLINHIRPPKFDYKNVRKNAIKKHKKYFDNKKTHK